MEFWEGDAKLLFHWFYLFYSGSRTLNPDEYAETVCGTPFYMAPEVLQFQRYNEKVKAWPLMTSLNDTEY